MPPGNTGQDGGGQGEHQLPSPSLLMVSSQEIVSALEHLDLRIVAV